MRTRVVVFPVRGKNWCFSTSIHPLASESESATTLAPSTIKDLFDKISFSSPKPFSSNAELLVDFVANKMNKAWTGLEKAPQGSFKNKIYGLGLRLLAGVKPSEIFLKSIPKEVTTVEVTYPSSLNPRLVRRRLRHMALRGTVIHKKYFYGSVSLLPLTTAFTRSSIPMAPEPEELKDEKNPRPLDEDDIALLKTYVLDLNLLEFEVVGVGEGLGPYSTLIKKAEKEIKDMAKKVNDLCGIKESDTGLAAPSQWDLVSDKQMMQEEQPLQVARCTKIINPNTEDAKYVINVKQIAKFVVGLGDKVSPTDIEEGMRVGVDRNKYQIQIPLPPKIDPSVTMMTVEEKPDVTYNDVGGCKEQIEKMREVVELPMLHPEKFVKLGIDPPKGVLCYGPPGTGKTLLARAVANRTDACFIRVIGSELVQKYVGEGARMVRELFQMARSKKACIVFFDEVDAIGGARFDDGVGGDNEVQRTMLEIVNQLDGFDARGNIKVLMATNRPDTLDPALLRPGRLDRKVEFGLPDLESRTQIFKIHTRTMNCERDIRFELLARLCPNSTGADIRSVCTEAGMYAIRARRKTVTEKDFLDAVNKVIKGYQKFSATPKYMVYN
ncbi:26S proteasome subunit P [Parasponia andersonii]|uniref:26S proteasome subunit P n=1 Tax=Parasponia andersonii TaxID=3476 RepID=A0A2P5C9I2_PARAD|nr:26S proteasome subunit P [Parasponia andersonii]